MSDKVADDFQRAGSQVSGGRQGSMAMSRTMSVSQKKANDPYHLDFTQLRKDYVHETTIQIPFVKSSFIHYSKCPRNMVINGKEYNDLVLTMELGQSPSTLDYVKLDDPIKVKSQEKARIKEEKRQQKLAEIKRARMAVKAEKQREKEAAKQVRLMERERRRAEREQMRRDGQLGSDEEEESEEDEDDDDDDEESDVDDDEIVVSEDEDEENEASEDESGGGSSGSGSEENSDESGTGDEDGQDREYTGDMFDAPPVKFLAGNMESTGMYNPKTETNDFCCVAIWSSGGKRMRYTRLKDTTLRMPPLAADQQFRVGHDAKRIFYIGELDGVKQLCIIYLKDLSHKYIKLGKHASQIDTLQDASLFKHYLCYRLTEKVEKKIRNKKCQKLIKNFYVFDLKKQEIVWELPDCENILFVGKNAAKLDMVAYQERLVKLRLDEESSSEDEEVDSEEEIRIGDEESEDIDSDGGSVEQCHRGILVIKTSEEEQVIEAAQPKEGEAEAKEAEDKEEGEGKKKKTFKFYRAYMPQWRHKVKKKRCVWETSIEVKPAAASTKAAQPVIAATDEFGETPMGQTAQLPMVEENEMLCTSDHTGAILALIIKGIKGEQHKVIMFNPEKKAPLSTVNRAGNTDLEFNMNSHLRPFTQIFICQTEANDQVTARRLNFDPNGDSGEENLDLPPISFTGAQRGFGKDCWCVDREESDSIPYIMTICKSSTDEYLNADCAVSEKIEDKEGANPFKTVLYSAKIKCQEIDVNYPCLVSNIGLSLVTIQSLTNPHTVATFNLEQQGMDFICFADYQNNADIGFKDKRDAATAESIPFNETADNIAFLTRKRGVDEDGAEKEYFDILLNVLSIDSYSRPMKFLLYTTQYDAYMGEGMSDDTIQKCVVSQVTSARGLDVAFIAQYNDRIIYDCITSTKQLPIRFPLPAKSEQEDDPDFHKEDCEFEQLDICKGAEVVRQSMIMDKAGAIYFMTKASNGTVKVLRTDPQIEMGDDQFIKTVYTLRSSKIYFLLFADNKFYLMDDTKRVRVLVPNAETFNWKLTQTLELCEKDQHGIIYSDFDEWTVSDGVLHGNDRLYYFLTSSSQDNPTWASEHIMLENHLHVSGPRYAKESGLIWYMQKHTLTKEDEVTAESHDELMQDDHLHGKVGHSAHGVHGHGHRHHRGYSIVMQPLGDLSYLDILPQRGENHNNYITFISEHYLLANFGGRFLVFDLKGHFQGPVQFMNMSEGFRGEALKLVNVSDSGKFFVFKGPRFLSKAERDAKKAEKEAKKQAKKQKRQENKKQGDKGGAGNKQFDENALEKKAQKALRRAEDFKSGGPKAPIFYIFKLETRNSFAHGMEWRFMPYKTTLFPFVEDLMSLQTTQRIDYKGLLSQCSVRHSADQSTANKRVLEILVKNYKSEDLQPPEVVQEQSFFSRFSAAVPGNPFSEEKYYMTFDPISRAQKHAVIQRKVQAEQKRILMGSGSQDALVRLQRREGQIDRAWIFNNYIVAKSGSEIKYIKRDESVLGMHQSNDIQFSITPGAEVWIENVISTGVNDLVQLFIVDDVNRRLFVITWNLQFNREHSLFQSTYAEDVFPENLIMRGKAYNKQQDFNYFLDNGAVINLDTNLPVQFFDIENEADTMPKGPLHAQVEGMVRISTDRSRYLDMTAPGRVHHFISFCDLLYWERFELLREKHEINKGMISSFSPIARFPKGISIFHYFATNAKVLSAVEEQMTIARQDNVDDVRLSMLPLVFLHSNPQLNKPGKKTTPIHIALDKQSPISFETMFQMLIDQHKVCVTSQLLDMLDTIIDSSSQSVLDFFDQSFYITDQFSGLRALEWEDPDADEKIIAIPSAYLTDEFMQSLVSTAEPEMELKEEPYYDDDEMFMDQELMKHDELLDAPCEYSGEVEPQTHVADDSNLKQIEAKILDFNWVFIGDNSARLISTLAQTENDSIFACSQIRVFVDFMWEGYYAAIFNQLFLPFVFYFASFVLYTCYFSHHESNQLGPRFIAEIVCLVILGKTFVTFVILELIQIRNTGLPYFFDVWNLVDVLSLALNAFYVYCEITNVISHQDLQLVASVATLLLWFKLFYWMRLFKPFSAFIRMITEIIKDIQVFMVMLIIALMAFANVIFILDLNRQEQGCGDSEECGPIYEALVGVAPIDALIHSYLTGLGEFGKDNYSMENAWTVWVMFILATLIVQLVFMNLLIAIMGDSFSRINEIMDQSTLKELCGIMEDHFWLQKIEELFESKRYILWLTPDTSTSGGTAVERQITQLKEQIKNNSEAQEQKIVRKIDGLAEDVAALKSLMEEALKKDEDEDEF